MTRRLLRPVVGCVLILALRPALALARQAGVPGPAVEVGIDVSATPDTLVGHGALGPHFTVNFSPRTAIEISGDLKPHESWPPVGSWYDSDSAYIQVRRALFQNGGFTTGATVGAALQRFQSY